MADTPAPAETPAATTPTPSPTPAASTTPAAAPAAAKPNGADDKPLAAGGGKPDEAATTPANWPENWPDIMAGGDAKLAAQYRRYHSPAAVGKALMSIRQKMDAGEMVRARPEGDPDDPLFQRELADWRATAGVPEKPDGYLDKVPDGLVFGDADKPMLDGFLKDMHAKDVPPQYVHEALRWYKANEERVLSERAVADKKHRAVAEDALRAELGPEYRPTMNGVHSLITTYGSEDLTTELYSARLADGTPLGDHPPFLKLMASLSREINPAGTVVPSGGTTPQAMATRKAELAKLMQDSRSEYHQGPNSAKLKAEYLDIIRAEEKIGRRKVA